ncbi:UPF0149 family protein [Luteimonas sp. SJ-92]|uniref:UPF0149 family protein n=1 Tax=Luteimonas salinisoli TaxID=2752307 RepID=A0A853J8P2_9GAMM|nr:UPF0149 family protein [Luteimonas salinisoli]NZA25020.1 UPF0149 family protein [Luteimonas salinisoli]
MSDGPVLDDAGVDRLSELLDRHAVPFGGMGLEMLDGFLSALAVAPEPLPVERWEPAVWGGRRPGGLDPEQAREIDDLLAAHQALAGQRARHGDAPLPDRLGLLLWLPEGPLGEGDDGLDIGLDWALGFFRAVELGEAGWDAWLSAEDWMVDALALIDRLVITPDLPEETRAGLAGLPGFEMPTYAERLEIVLALPGILSDLHCHRIAMLTPRVPLQRAATPERNAPCPCGSGRKYKKCCGG